MKAFTASATCSVNAFATESVGYSPSTQFTAVASFAWLFSVHSAGANIACTMEPEWDFINLFLSSHLFDLKEPKQHLYCILCSEIQAIAVVELGILCNKIDKRNR